jgi:hypothetical protein
MSYEDITEARAVRAAKERSVAEKKSRSRKRKNQPSIVDVPEQRAPVARMI